MSDGVAGGNTGQRDGNAVCTTSSCVPVIASVAVRPYPSPLLPENLSLLRSWMHQTLINHLTVDGGHRKSKAIRSVSGSLPESHALLLFYSVSRASSQASIWVDSQATVFGPNFTGGGRWPSWTHRQSVVRCTASMVASS
jgi:hypothetical protein